MLICASLLFLQWLSIFWYKKQITRNAENKDWTGAFWVQNLNLSSVYGEKKRQSLWKSEYSHFHNDWFFFSKTENIVVPDAVEQSRTGAFRSQDQTLSFFFRLKKNNHYENESILALMLSISVFVLIMFILLLN
jgi:hypothetical protein